MESAERKEALLKLAQITEVPNAEKYGEFRLELEIEGVLSALNDQFTYIYDVDSDPNSKTLVEGAYDEDDEHLTAAQAIAELQSEEDENIKKPEAKDVAKYNYEVLNALNLEECRFLYDLMQSGDKGLNKLASLTMALSVRALICYIMHKISFRYKRGNDESVREMRTAGLGAAWEATHRYDPYVLKDSSSTKSATFFTFAYNPIRRALLRTMHKYDSDNHQAKSYFDLKNEVDRAVASLNAQGVDPTYEQTAAWINLHTARDKGHTVTAAQVRSIIESPSEISYDNAQENQISLPGASTADIETDMALEQILRSLPPMQRDVVLIIMELMPKEKTPSDENIMKLLRRRYPETSDAELGSAIIEMRHTFAASFGVPDYMKVEVKDPLIEAILCLEDYTDEMLNILENTDPEDIFG